MVFRKFNIIPVTEKVKEKYSQYSSMAAYFIINPDGEFEWETDSINEAKDWIRCY